MRGKSPAWSTWKPTDLLAGLWTFFIISHLHASVNAGPLPRIFQILKFFYWEYTIFWQAQKWENTLSLSSRAICLQDIVGRQKCRPVRTTHSCQNLCNFNLHRNAMHAFLFSLIQLVSVQQSVLSRFFSCFCDINYPPSSLLPQLRSISQGALCPLWHGFWNCTH